MRDQKYCLIFGKADIGQPGLPASGTVTPVKKWVYNKVEQVSCGQFSRKNTRDWKGLGCVCPSP